MVRIQISNDPSGRIIVSFPYDPVLVTKVKTIGGRRWHPAEKHWSFPNRGEILEKIIKGFAGNEVPIDPALKTEISKLKDTPSPLRPKGTVPDLRTERSGVVGLTKDKLGKRLKRIFCQ
jgi:hypothetical protein